MKFLIVTAALVAVAVAGPTKRFLPIHVGPAIVEDSYEPIHVGPALVEDSYQPIHIGPAIVEDSYEPIHIGPVLVEDSYEPIHVGPALVEGDVSPVAPAASSPLVQIIINVNKDGQVVGTPEVSEIEPSPVHVVESPIYDDIVPTPVEVVEVAPVELENPSIPIPGIPAPVPPMLPNFPVLHP